MQTCTSGIVRILAADTARPVHGRAATRRLETAALAALPAHALMRRAGLAVAQLAMAVAPGGPVIALCGPGNNGGDALEAAMHLRRAGRDVQIILLGDPSRQPADAAMSLQRAQAAGVPMAAALPDRLEPGLVIDGLLGLGASRAPDGAVAEAIRRLQAAEGPVLAVDLPSGLDPATGSLLGTHATRATHTLALLTLQPGLFMVQGRDHCGEIWLHTLGVDATSEAPLAWLAGADKPGALLERRRHAQHKGSFGDVLVIAGAPGMAGAGVLAARAALAAGAGRVILGLLDPATPSLDTLRPELMLRPGAWQDRALVAHSTVVCGCGGGDAVQPPLAALLGAAPRLVLDADALNAVAQDAALQASLRRRSACGRSTLLTPHPLEAGRLLGISAAEVQADRLDAARQLAGRFDCAVVLKGSGTVIAAPDALPWINPTGNPLLAAAGTGDVLAGWLGGLWSQAAQTSAQSVGAAGVYLHGRAADHAAIAGQSNPLRASDLIESLHRGD